MSTFSLVARAGFQWVDTSPWLKLQLEWAFLTTGILSEILHLRIQFFGDVVKNAGRHLGPE